MGITGNDGTVGGVVPADRNLLAGNSSAGIQISGGTNTQILGNLLGTTSAGNTRIVIAGDAGIQALTGNNSRIGSAAAGNVIGGDAFGIEAGSDDLIIENNIIGTDGSYSADLGGSGPAIDSNGARSSIIDNVIGNFNRGVEIGGVDAIITGNSIGSDSGGTIDLGMDTYGVELQSTGARLGGPATADTNIVAFNGGVGIQSNPSVDSTILRNRIFGNGSLGIDLLGDGVTTNSGADSVLDHPVITSAPESGGTITVGFDLDLPAGDYRIELFTNAAGPDPSGYGEGQTFVNATTVTHAGSGVESFSIPYSGIGGVALAATATQDLGGGSYGASSEFSPIIETCSDSDGDGLCTHYETPFGDTDGDTLNNEDDGDDDGDGILTISEIADPNGDHDPRDAIDSDNDGQPDWLDHPTTSAGTTVDGEQKISSLTGGLTATLDNDDAFGSSAVAIGDLDGDGIVDLAVGAHRDDDGGANRGAINILFLNADGTVKAEQKISDTTGGLTANLDDGDRFGSGVASIGDLDGDGRNELAVGALRDDDGGSGSTADRGAVYVLFLNADGTVRAEQKISDTTGGLTAALDDDVWFGASTTDLGDLDNDGTNDLVVGAPNDDDGGLNSGAVYVLFLNADGTVKAEQKISDTTGGLVGTLTGDYFGSSITGLGDLDSDGNPDIAVGSRADDDGGTDRGAVYVLFLNADGTVKAEQKVSDTTGGLATGLADGDHFGGAVAALGDLYDRGSTVLAVGAFGNPYGTTNTGAVRLLELNSAGTAVSTNIIDQSNGGLTGPLESEDAFGGAIAAIGDLDGDGAIGMAVGAYGDDDGGIGRGAVYVLDLMRLAVVNSTGDADDNNPGDNVCDTGALNADGAPECTLRAAITEANLSAPIADIVFQIPSSDSGWNAGQGTWTISPATPLPTVTAAVTIDGTVQPGFTPSTAAAPAAMDGRPVIELNGTSAGPTAAGIRTQAPVTITGLIINRFEAAGVSLDAGSDGSQLLASFIGTDHAGLTPLQTGASSIAVRVSAANVIVGGSTPGARNLLSGNQTAVEAATAAAAGLRIEGNLIGVGADGVTAVANNRGVLIANAASATVTNNVIAANTTDGLELQATAADVTGNRIGVDGADNPAGNGGAGVLTTDANGTTIGGTTGQDLNTIANNGSDGIAVTSGSDLTIIGNSIHTNGGLAVDWLDDGITTNDSPDADGVLNRPTITLLNLAGATATAEFDLDVAAGNYRIEFFRNTAADGSGSGEAETLLGTTTVAHTGTGAEPFSFPFTATAGELISATATLDQGAGSFGTTSELAVTVAVNTPPTFDQDHTVVTAAEGETVSLATDATDLDLDTLTWSASGLPPGLSINPTSGAITGTVSATAGAGNPYSVTATVTDGRGGADTDTFSWTVTDTNRAPTLAPITDVTADEQTAIAFTATATDADLPTDTIVYSGTNLPGGASINPTTGDFSWTPTEAQGPGSYSITITATDNGTPSLDDAQSFTITVNEANIDPVLDTIADQVTGEGSVVTLTPTVTDPDLPINTLVWSASDLPPGLAINPATGVVSGAVSAVAGAGSPYSSTIGINDGAGGTDSTDFTWTIVDTNRNPVLAPITDVTLTEGDTATFTASATDPDLPADNLTLSASGLPPGSSFDVNTGIFSWPTTEADGPTVAIVTITVTDDGSPPLQTSQPVTVTVEEENQTPSLDPLADLVGGEESTITFTAAASDPDLPADDLTWSASDLPPGASIEPATGDFSWTPTESQGPGQFTFTITVADDAVPPLSESRTMTINVDEENVAPVVTPIDDQVSSEASEISLAAVATDPDLPANDITWSATGLPQGLSIDAVSGAITGTVSFEAAADSPHTVTITADDGAGATDEHSFSWSVAGMNRTPTITTPGQYLVDEGGQLVVAILAEDPDLDSLTFVVTDPPLGLTIDQDSGIIAWSPDEDQGPATYTFQVIVDDGQAAVAADVTIVVAEHNQPPTIAEPSTQQAVAGTRFTLGLSAADPDLPRNTLLFALVNGPSGMTVDPVSGLLSWTPDETFIGTVTAEVEVVDSGVPAQRDRTSITIDVVPSELNFDSDVPVATGDTFFTGYKQPIKTDVLANDLGGGLTLLDAGEAVGGTVQIVNDELWFIPDEGFVGVATFTYRVRQANGTIASATATVVVSPPELSLANDLITTMSGRPVAIEVLANDKIVGAVQTFDFTQPENGEASLLADQQIQYAPAPSFVGQDEFTYTIADAYGTTRSAQIAAVVTEPELPETTETLTDIDIQETDVPVVTPTALSFADLSEALIDAIRQLSVPFRLIVIAGAWATLLALALIWLGARGSVGAVTNAGRGKRVPAIDPRTGRILFHFRSDADLIWMGRRRRRRGVRYRKVETPHGPGLVEDRNLCDMNTVYLESNQTDE